MNNENDLKLSVQYADFWTDGGSIRGVLTAPEAAAEDGLITLDELTNWELNWTGGSSIEAFSISSETGSATALLPPGGFLLDGTNTAFDASNSDADGLDQGLFESASGDQTIDLGALIVEDLTTETVALGDSGLGSIVISPVINFEVEYSGFWADGGSVIGGFSVSEADAADGVVTTDELIAWNWNWSGNSEVAAFSISSEDGVVADLLPLTGFLLEGMNTPVDGEFADPDGIDQGLYESVSGEQVIDLGALVIQDFTADALSLGDISLGSISLKLAGNESSGSEDDDGIEIGSDADAVIRNALFEGNGDDGVDIEGDNSKVTIKEILSTQNAEEGLEIDGSNNEVMISNASFSANGDDGFDLDETGTGNLITVTSVSFSDNGDDGFDILGAGNTVFWNGVSSTGNTEEGFEVDGIQNTITISNASLSNNGEDGFDIDATGLGNLVFISNTTFEGNGDDGFDIFGEGNAVQWNRVSSTGNAEEGFEIDGKNNSVVITDSSLSGNLDDGFQIDAEGTGNIVNISNSTIANNVDGIDINGSDNIIGLFQVGFSGNSGNGIEVEGDNNTVNITRSTFSNSGEFALLIEGDNNRVNIIDSLFMGSGNSILDMGSNNVITVMNSTGLDSVVVSDSSTLLMLMV